MMLAILVALVASVGASAPSPAAPAFRVLVVAANDRFHGAMSDAAEPLLESLGAESGFAVRFTHDATLTIVDTPLLLAGVDETGGPA